MGLSADQLEELKKAFAAIDANGDGVISKDELSTLLKGLGEDVGDDVVTEMMNLADTDGDGKVNFEEFCKAASSWDGSLSDFRQRLHKIHNHHMIMFRLWNKMVRWYFDAFLLNKVYEQINNIFFISHFIWHATFLVLAITKFKKVIRSKMIAAQDLSTWTLSRQTYVIDIQVMGKKKLGTQIRNLLALKFLTKNWACVNFYVQTYNSCFISIYFIR